MGDSPRVIVDISNGGVEVIVRSLVVKIVPQDVPGLIEDLRQAQEILGIGGHGEERVIAQYEAAEAAARQRTVGGVRGTYERLEQRACQVMEGDHLYDPPENWLGEVTEVHRPYPNRDLVEIHVVRQYSGVERLIVHRPTP